MPENDFVEKIKLVIKLLSGQKWTGKITFVLSMTGGGISAMKVIQEEDYKGG